MRPEIGAVMAVYPRLMRAILSAASACWIGGLRRGDCFPVTFHLRLDGLQRGLGHLGLGDGLVALAGGDGTLLEGLLEPLAVRPGEVEGGLLPGHVGEARLQRRPRPVGVLLYDGEVGRGVVQGRLEGRRIDLVERLAGLDLGAFRKEPLLDEAAHLGTDLGDQMGGGPSGQFRGDHQPLRLDRHDGDFGRSTLRGSACGCLPATAQDQEPGEHTPGNDSFCPVIILHATPLSFQILRPIVDRSFPNDDLARYAFN